ncbi:MAG: hypothetical protein AB7P18_03895 [Candidatus Binatia bacterium]
MLSTEEILENVVQLVSLFDDLALLSLTDTLPVLELAKWVVCSWPGQEQPASSLTHSCFC